VYKEKLSRNDIQEHLVPVGILTLDGLALHSGDINHPIDGNREPVNESPGEIKSKREAGSSYCSGRNTEDKATLETPSDTNI
jgi:hypothetical protein